MCSVDYGDAPSIWSDAARRARKPHKCDECDREIAAGEIYRYATMLYDGHWNSFYTCAHCRVGQVWLIRECGGFLHHGLAEEIQEHIEEYPDLLVGLGRVRLGIQRRWKRFDGKGLMRVPPVAGSPKYGVAR
jgi:hypothetical protein